MYYQKKLVNCAIKTILVLLFPRIIHLPLTVRTINNYISFVRVYICLYACHSPMSVHPSIYVNLAHVRPCVCPYPL